MNKPKRKPRRPIKRGFTLSEIIGENQSELLKGMNRNGKRNVHKRRSQPNRKAASKQAE
ncbi:hypothetical protein [Lederbergia ruris]|uniref:hypothetical protein n=1 Tax=Lederbergia ruris TaxID=217495 RepID=UPI001BB3CA24|nr:hypothetical protein [Lederbergia ruris]